MSSSNTSPRWGRSGEPGSAFSGLGRGGRGRGRGVPRGRGAFRGQTRDLKSDTAQTKDIPPSPPTMSSSTPSELPNSPAKSKPPSRRASRSIPPAIDTHAHPVDVTPAPASAKPASRRRRSQAGKSNQSGLPKINPPAPNDNLVRPNRHRLPAVPFTAPLNNNTPHRFGMRDDINALVERVRAVAMDNRPSTPGSHIDWAGDDDDSLPDLNDWGVKPTTLANPKSDVISPILVDGLKSLPDFAPVSHPSPPPRKAEQSEEPRTLYNHGASASVEGELSDSFVTRVEADAGPVSSPTLKLPCSNSSTISKYPLHPSLPRKPVTGPLNSQLKHRPGATPMRNPRYPKTPVASENSKSVSESKFIMQDDVAPNFAQTSFQLSTDITSEINFELPGQKDKLSFKPSESSTTPVETMPIPEPLVGDEGLAASMHAPNVVSAPPSISFHNLSQADTYATVTSFPSPARAFPVPEYTSRHARSGYSTPRGGVPSHVRTHSTPPVGDVRNHRRFNSSRPVLTGDAISSLARSIGKIGISSPKSQTMAT